MDAYAAYPSLELDRPAPHVLRLTLRAAGKLNAVGADMHGELAAVWKTIGADDETRAVIVRGADGAFSAGGDLDLVLAIADDAETRIRVFHEARDLVYNVIDCPKPIVSAITGPAVGAGLAVGLLADISIATPAARIVDGHTKLGVAAGDHAAMVSAELDDGLAGPTTRTASRLRSTWDRSDPTSWSVRSIAWRSSTRLRLC